MLEKSKRNGNKYYQFYDNYNQYQARCKESDQVGYDVVFGDEVEKDEEKMNIEDREVQDEIDNEGQDDEDNDSEKDDIEYETKDPVKKYQFEYNKSLCMANKYPEISANESDTVSVAPGEGKIPKDIMCEGDWCIEGLSAP